jgi:hypothetical protein
MNSYDITLDPENQIVKIKAYGELFQKDGEEIITAARLKAAEHKYNVLYDMREATTTVNFASWFELPRKLDVFKNAATRSVKAAVLASNTDKAVDDYKFYEIVTDNIGIKIRVFFDEAEAVSWLAKKPLTVD